MIEHGTRKGFQAHVARGHRGVQICDECREAQNRYMRDYMRNRYNPTERRARYLRSKAQTHVQEAA